MEPLKVLHHAFEWDLLTRCGLNPDDPNVLWHPNMNDVTCPACIGSVPPYDRSPATVEAWLEM